MRANGEAIRDLRLERGIALRDLAQAAGLDRGFLSRVERGQRDASEENLALIAGVLGVEVARILAPPEPEPEPSGQPLVYSPVRASAQLDGIKTPQWLVEKARAGKIPHTRLGQTICFTPKNLSDLLESGFPKPRRSRRAAKST